MNDIFKQIEALEGKLLEKKLELLFLKAYEKGVEDGQKKYSYPHTLRKNDLMEIFQVELSTINRIVSRPDFPKLTVVQARYPRDKVFEWIDQHTAILDKHII